MKEKYLFYERKVSLFFKTYSVHFLKYSMAIVYFWYGVLKVLGISPVEQLVYEATHWLGVHEFVRVLGIWEMAIGIFLVIPKLMRVGLLLLFLQFPGTFLPLFLTPDCCFTAIPFALTLRGQYVFKNLILLSAALALVGSLHNRPKKN